MTEPALERLDVGAGFVLRRPAPEDVAGVLMAALDPDVARWNPLYWDDAPVRDVAAATAWLGSRADWALDDGRPLTHVSWTLVDADDACVGALSVHQVDTWAATASIGYWVLATHRGRGLATRAVSTATAAVLAAGLERVELAHAVANPGSCAVATRAGYALEGTLRESYRYGDGAWYDEHVHSAVRDPTVGGRP